MMQHPIYASEFIMYSSVKHAPAYCPPHAHECFELLYILEGCCRIETESNVYIAEPHDLVIFKPYQCHEETQLSEVYALVCMRFPAEFVAEHHVPFPELSSLPTVIALPQGDRFRDMLDHIVAEYQRHDSYSISMIGSYLFQFAVLLRRALHQMPQPLHAQQASWLQDLLDQHIGGSVSIRDLARQVHMSESHFSHLAKELLGVAPKTYVRERKIARAQQLLQSTPMSIEEIASALGYDAPTSFFRAFKRVTGTTPGSFRAAIRDHRTTC
jgi:AraC family transcriptional activator of pobA